MWHPHCTSVVDVYDREYVDFTVIPESEIDASDVEWCGYVDRDRIYVDEEWPEAWTCPDCGGTSFELVEIE